jgi:hypothetical protein
MEHYIGASGVVSPRKPSRRRLIGSCDAKLDMDQGRVSESTAIDSSVAGVPSAGDVV